MFFYRGWPLSKIMSLLLSEPFKARSLIHMKPDAPLQKPILPLHPSGSNMVNSYDALLQSFKV